MEDELIFTDAEQTLVDQLVATIYYPTKQALSPVIDAVIRLTTPAQKKIYSSAVASVSFQQRQRQDYILGVVLGGVPFAGSDPRLAISQLVAVVEQPTLGSEAITEFGNQAAAINVAGIRANADLVKQVQLYKEVGEQLITLEAQFYAKYNVLPFINLLEQYSADELTQLIQFSQSYISQVNQRGLDGLLSDIPLTPGLADLLQKTNLNLIFTRTDSTGERLQGLTNILTIASAITQNRSQPTQFPKEQLVELVARLLARSNIAVLFPE